MSTQPVLYLTVGLPGSGKTTWARRVAAEQRILRLTPDEWMAPLFGASDVDGRRDILEGRMIWVAHEVLRSGASVVLDFGCWSPEERSAIRSIAESTGAGFVLHHTEIDEADRRARARLRWQTAPETTFAMSEDDHDRFAAAYVPPSSDELAGAPVPPVPAGHEDWFDWAAQRWPTLPRRWS